MPSISERALKAWLVARSGSQAGFRYAIGPSGLRIGRGLEADLVLDGPEAAGVSAAHAEILPGGSGFMIRDLGSTNGTFVDGVKVEEAALQTSSVIQLGAQGPEFTVAVEDTAISNLDRTQVIQEGTIPEVPSVLPISPAVEGILSKAVRRARRARLQGAGDQTIGFMRDAIHHALRHSRRRWRMAVILLVVGLGAVTGGAALRVAQLHRERGVVERRIQEIEAKLEQTANVDEADRLFSELGHYESEAEKLRRSPLYRVQAGPGDFVTEQIRVLMAEFGSEVYSVPAEFTERVKHYIAEYEGPNRQHMANALGPAADKVAKIRKVIEEASLPGDLAYVPVVESALGSGSSSMGAAGWWQFTPATARAFGLRVEGQVDERTDAVKSTRAACRLLRDLILDFGNGSSVMLALAAYNGGPTKVKQAVKAVKDPIRQRNFWYLYRTKALPSETREYVPKVVAAMIVGRNAKRFGF